MKKFLILALLAAFLMPIESCKPKHACGTMHQKKQRNKRIKKGTNFMTYWKECK